jgi:aminopeptidase N
MHYTFRITLSDENDEVTGEATIEVRFLADGVSQLALDLAGAAGPKGMTVASVTSGGSPVKFRHEANRLELALQPAAKAEERRTFTVSYHGIPAGGLRIGPNRHGERTFFSENWPDKARGWLPVIDHPHDKSTSEFIVTAPAKYQVVANGRLEEERDLGDGRRLTHWKQGAPIATWLNALAVAQFAKHHAGNVQGVPLETWVFARDRDAALAAIEGTARRSLEFFVEHIGPYPYEKLANIQATGFEGGMEHASAIFYGERTVLGRDARGVIAHEIAHQWFGDAVTERDWDEIWLSEGFATYFAHLFVEHDRGRDAFVAGLERDRETVFRFEARQPGLAVIHDNIKDTQRILSPLVYQKAGWVLHMLHGQIGDDAFWSGIRAYYRQYRDGNASTDDFRRVMEEAGGANLEWFFRQWLNRAGSPVIEGTWRYDSETKRIEIELVQQQTGAVYRLPLEIGIAADGSAEPRAQRVELVDRRQRFDIAADQAPAAVTLDPGCWTLMKATFGPKSDAR